MALPARLGQPTQHPPLLIDAPSGKTTVSSATIIDSVVFGEGLQQRAGAGGVLR
jgi:hypothetical protein